MHYLTQRLIYRVPFHTGAVFLCGAVGFLMAMNMRTYFNGAELGEALVNPLMWTLLPMMVCLDLVLLFEAVLHLHLIACKQYPVQPAQVWEQPSLPVGAVRADTVPPAPAPARVGLARIGPTGVAPRRAATR